MARVTALACQGPDPEPGEAPRTGETHYTLRRLAADAVREGIMEAISPETVRRMLRRADLRPHRWRYWLTRTDPRFHEKARRILDFYEHGPPEGRLLCFDEKTQMQAIQRKHPTLPMRAGLIERREFEYVRRGTLNLFCALNVTCGTVVGQTYERKRAVEMADFLGVLRAAYPGEVLHVILDNLSTHTAPPVREFLDEDGGIHLHFLPTHGSWLNQVELFFSVLARRVLRRGNFTGLADLGRKILAFLRHWNEHEKKPFRWSYTSAQLAAA